MRISRRRKRGYYDPTLGAATDQGGREALSISGLGITPSNDGKIIRVPLPPLTEERRKELSKICKKHGEDTKVHIRGFRRDANEELKKLQKDAKLTEDELTKIGSGNSKADRSIRAEDRRCHQEEGTGNPRSLMGQPRFTI